MRTKPGINGKYCTTSCTAFMLLSVVIVQCFSCQECSAATTEYGTFLGNLTTFGTDFDFLHHVRAEPKLFQVPKMDSLSHFSFSSPLYTSLYPQEGHLPDGFSIRMPQFLQYFGSSSYGAQSTHSKTSALYTASMTHLPHL